ncbi:MAG TPA: mercury(II) reductase [Jiangellaceae bacterium]
MSKLAGDDEESLVALVMRMAVDGMTCDSCNVHVADALRSAGAVSASADWRRGKASFTADETTDLDQLAESVRDSGYTPGRVAPLAAVGEQSAAAGIGRDYDLAIVGSGSAAFAAAIRARDLGARVVMVERSTIGGTCVNVGCVPSKALLRAAETIHDAGHHPFAGVDTSAHAVDLRMLVAQKDELVTGLRKEKYEDLVGEYGIDLVRGVARFADERTLNVDGQPLQAGAYIIAAGASAAVPPIPGLAEAGYLKSADALDLHQVPGSVAVIGANAIGLELGQFFLHVGSQVMFFDVLDRIAPFEELEISAALSDVLREQGAQIHAPARITRVELDGDRRVVVADVDGDERRFVVDQILVATGRRPNTADLNTEAAGIALDDNGAIVVNETLRTHNPIVFAAGDVTSAPQLVYVAAHQGALAAENALPGRTRRTDLAVLPRVTFTSPQIAAVGLTEDRAREVGHAVRTSVLPLTAVPRALVNHDTRGVIKIVADEATDKVLGVHMLADGAGDVIQAAVYAIKFGLTVTDLAESWSPYLTMAEGLKLAAQGFTRDVSKLSCCAA